MNKELTIKSIEDVLRRFVTLEHYKDKRYAYGSSRVYNTYDIAEEIYNTVTKAETKGQTNSLTNIVTNCATSGVTKAGTNPKTNVKTKKK
jgi:hypothetical protein